jgi:ABC-type lipoprotein export system ATPase subunit
MGLSLQDVRKSYLEPGGGVLPVLDVPAFHVATGEQVALVGTSGGGKTTLLHVIAGILTPDAGTVLIESRSPNQSTPVKVNIALMSEADRDRFRGQHIGYIFQTHHLLPGFTALENVLLGMSFTGRPADRAWARHLLDAVGLKERLQYVPGKLSVGQQQRVAVARALANRPGIVLADEPTGALDFVNARQVLGLIRSLCAEVNASLLMVTHDRGIADQMQRSVNLSDVNRAARQPGDVTAGVSA